METCVLCVWLGPQCPADGVRSPRTGVIDGFELPCRFWIKPGFSGRAVIAPNHRATFLALFIAFLKEVGSVDHSVLVFFSEHSLF